MVIGGVIGGVVVLQMLGGDTSCVINRKLKLEREIQRKYSVLKKKKSPRGLE